MSPLARLAEEGLVHLPATEATGRWAAAALAAGQAPIARLSHDPRWLRHGGTWFVGVDALPNDATGAVGGVPFPADLQALLPPMAGFHPGQLSVCYEGYPRQDAGESDAAHRYRRRRDGAHVDGLILEAGRRFPREPHAFVLGLALTPAPPAPLVVWRGSHHLMGAAFRDRIGRGDPRDVDVTDTYVETRRTCFEEYARVVVEMAPGGAVLVHRLALHGIAPHDPAHVMPEAGRQMAYFRPLSADPAEWLSEAALVAAAPPQPFSR